MNNHAETFGLGASWLVAVVICYVTFPSFQAVIAPEIPPLWDPVLSIPQTLGVLVSIVSMAILVALVGRLRSARANQEPFVPVAFWVGLFIIS